LFFYLPDGSLKKVDNEVAQQIDVLPTTLAILKYNQPFFAFGSNLMDSAQIESRFAVNYYNICHQYFTRRDLIQYDGNRTIGFYNYINDTLMKFNRVKNTEAKMKTDEKRAQAFIQQYNNRVIHNHTVAK